MVLVDETGLAADEVELAVFELFAPVPGELADQPAFASLHLLGHDPDIFRPQTKFPRPPQGDETVGRFDHRLARHAAAQDAEAADITATFDHGGFQTQGDGGTRRRVACAATTDDHEIVHGNIGGVGGGGITHEAGNLPSLRKS